MILPDVNVPVHAHNSDSRVHAVAGNLTTDAHLAVPAMERGYVLSDRLPPDWLARYGPETELDRICVSARCGARGRF